MKKYYLITTDHLEDSLWFRDNEDFVTGMNMVAVQASISEVVVLAFILMSNHVHFVVYGTRRDAEEFISRYKGRYSQYYGRKWGVKEFLRRNKAEVDPISENPEDLERAIAYVIMNCVAARICLNPGQYPWGCGNCFFQAKSEGLPGRSRLMSGAGRKQVKDLSKRALSRILHSDVRNLPGDWAFSDEGFILPESYIAVQAVETLFRTPARMDYFLRTSSKAKKRLEDKDDNLPSFKDQVISVAVPDLCQSLFQKKCFEDLLEQEKTEMLRQLRYRFSAGPNQLARVCGISYAEAARLIDSR